MQHTDNEQVQTRVAPAIRKKLEKAAEAEGISIAAYVRRLLMQHVKEIK
jgi:predicted HicB family RNase H-like nuclease